MKIVRVLAIAGIAVLLGSCNLVLPSDQRVTFALVLNDRSYNGHMVYAEVQIWNEDQEATDVASVSGTLVNYPSTSNEAWAQMTTLEVIPTNQVYFLVFWIDVDDDGIPTTTVDLEGIQNFYVAPNAIWAETKYYAEELTPVS